MYDIYGPEMKALETWYMVYEHERCLPLVKEHMAMEDVHMEDVEMNFQIAKKSMIARILAIFGVSFHSESFDFALSW